MFHGSIVALVTPMDSAGRVDEEALLRLLDFQLEGGSNGIVVAGTTGESATLTDAEIEGLIEVTVRHVDGRVPVIAGTGNPGTARTIERTLRAADAGADAALVVTPSYNRPTQAGLEAHFRAVAEACELPLLLYNVPSRTAVDLQPATVDRLADIANVVGLKEAVGTPERVRDQLAICEGRLDLLSGDDGTCAAAMGAGAQGVISVAANVVPERMSRLCAAAARGDAETVAAIDRELHELYGRLGVETNPIPVKWMLLTMGLIGPGIRLPLLPLDEAHRQGVEACLETLGLAPGENT